MVRMPPSNRSSAGHFKHPRVPVFGLKKRIGEHVPDALEKRREAEKREAGCVSLKRQTVVLIRWQGVS
jgi:hypothetical protein